MKNLSDYEKTQSATVDLPCGAFKNESSPGQKDGTDILAEHIQDLAYPLYQVLQLAGEVPNGELEDGNNKKQFLQALCNIGFFKYSAASVYAKGNIVLQNIDGTLSLYRSLISNNNFDLSDLNSWTKLITVENNNRINFYVETNIGGGSGSNMPVFCFNSGPVDENGDSALLTLDNNIITMHAPAVCTSAGGETSTVSEDVSLDISELEAGTYNVFYNPETNGLEVYSNTIFRQKSQPQNWAVNDIWVDDSVLPRKSYMKKSDMETLECKLIPSAVISTISGGEGSLMLNPYNVSACLKQIKSHISNCILEIPERIKVDLTDGVLTLKKGSVLIVPAGFETDGTTPKFNYVETDNDCVFTPASTSTVGLRQLFYAFDTHTILYYTPKVNIFSGATEPPKVSMWYDTANNLIKFTQDSGATWKTSNVALPFADVDILDMKVTSILDIFNGTGYMGSTTWADKGIKALYPNYRNADGTLNSIEYTTEKLFFMTFANDFTRTANLEMFLRIDGETPAFFISTVSKYDSVRNVYSIVSAAGTPSNVIQTPISSLKVENGVITSFKTYKVFQAADANATTAYINNPLSPIGRPIICLYNETLSSDEIWLEGATVSRTTYAELFAKYGTTYGAGDGSTTFVLPDFRNRALWGSNGYGYLAAGLPNIAGAVSKIYANNSSTASGALQLTYSNQNTREWGSGCSVYTLNLNASSSNAIYGKSSTVQPNAIKLRVKTRYK